MYSSPALTMLAGQPSTVQGGICQAGIGEG
jgi:hypothetical protein